MNHKFLIFNFEFLIPTHPHFTTVGRGSFKIQNSKFKIQNFHFSELKCCN